MALFVAALAVVLLIAFLTEGDDSPDLEGSPEAVEAGWSEECAGHCDMSGWVLQAFRQWIREDRPPDYGVDSCYQPEGLVAYRCDGYNGSGSLGWNIILNDGAQYGDPPALRSMHPALSGDASSEGTTWPYRARDGRRRAG